MKKAVKLKPKKDNQEQAKAEVAKAPSFIASRFWLIYLIVILGCLALFNKGFSLQVENANDLINKANKLSLRETHLPFVRGNILDRNGRLLATTVPAYSIGIDPKAYFDHFLGEITVDTRSENKKRRYQDRWKLLAREVGGSASKIKAQVKTFLDEKKDDKQPPTPKQKKYDPKVLFNLNSDGYWQLLARATGISYEQLNSQVRQNPNSVFVNLEQQRINFEKEKLKALAKSLNLKYETLMNQLYKASIFRFISLTKKSSESLGEYVKKLKINNLVVTVEPRRFYPLGEESAQLIGFTDTQPENKKFIVEKGKGGLEKHFNSLLIGKNGKQLTRKDGKGNTIERIRDEKLYNPQDVMLSIDEELQSMAYREIKKAVQDHNADSATAVLIDIQTGEILAMVNAPSYNPNNRETYTPLKARNFAILETFEPGSTVKPFVVLTALQNKVTYLGDVINTRPFTLNGHLIKDPGVGRDSSTLKEILQKSSNVGVSRLAMLMPPNALVDSYKLLGFGKNTGLGLGEASGKSGDRPRWSEIERAALSYGYGLEITPLQLAKAYATLGSFGISRPLSITKVDPPVIGERIFSENITREVVKMMESVAEKGGTGRRAAVENFRVAVKTGTAKKVLKGQKVYSDEYLTYTAGIAPASNPRFALVVLVDNPKVGGSSGGQVASPLFSKIMGYTLKARNVKPDNITDNSRNAIRELKPNPMN